MPSNSPLLRLLAEQQQRVDFRLDEEGNVIPHADPGAYIERAIREALYPRSASPLQTFGTKDFIETRLRGMLPEHMFTMYYESALVLCVLEPGAQRCYEDVNSHPPEDALETAIKHMLEACTPLGVLTRVVYRPSSIEHEALDSIGRLHGAYAVMQALTTFEPEGQGNGKG